jgi:hypothetical protein
MEEDFTTRLARVAGLIEALEAASDPELRETAREVVRTLLELHQRGLRRALELASAEPLVLRALTGDADIQRLLFLHGLHPVPPAERLAAALDELGPRLENEGAHAELVAIEEGTVRLRFHGGPGARRALLGAIERAAPDAGEVVVEEFPHLVQLRVKPSCERASGGPEA